LYRALQSFYFEVRTVKKNKEKETQTIIKTTTMQTFKFPLSTVINGIKELVSKRKKEILSIQARTDLAM
jgi:hypothetical protein